MVSTELVDNILDRDSDISSYDLIFLSASSGAGKSYQLRHSETLKYSHHIVVNLSGLHNDGSLFWHEVSACCREKQWLKSTAINENNLSRSILALSKELNCLGRQYSQPEKYYLIFDNTHLIKNPTLLEQVLYFIQQLDSSICCVFSGQNSKLQQLCLVNSAKKFIVFNESSFLKDKEEFNKINRINSLFQNDLTSEVADLVHAATLGHVGLALICISTNYVKQLLAVDKIRPRYDFTDRLIQSPEVHHYFRQLTVDCSQQELEILSLPLLNRELINILSQHKFTAKELESFIGLGHFKSEDSIEFYPSSILESWIQSNAHLEYSELLITAIKFYQKKGYWAEAIQCAIRLEYWPLAVELVSKAALHFSRQGQYQQARQLINRIPKEEKRGHLHLSIFENLLDFQQYGHQFANEKLHILISNSAINNINEDNQRLIILLQHHYALLVQPGLIINEKLGIEQYHQLFNSNNEFCSWAWHSLAMEKLLAGDQVTGLEYLIKAIYWSLEQEDAPCVLASLGWLLVPCLQLGKLSFVLGYCDRIEAWLKVNNLESVAMASTLYRVRLIVFREQGKLLEAEDALQSMRSYYANLDPLNLAYCYWAEFLYALAQQNLVGARLKLSELEAHAIMHFDGWQLALPKPELLFAIIDGLSGDELAMLNWASHFQLDHIDEDKDWLKMTSPSSESEIIAYIRVRITLGSDMAEECEQLFAQAELKQNKLLALHVIILKLLNAHRQENESEERLQRHLLLIKAGTLEFNQLYREYLDELLPLLIDYRALPSELQGYNKIIPRDVNSGIENIKPQTIDQQLSMDESSLFQSLTDREKEIALLIIEGMANKEISIRLNIGLATVKGHASNIYNKLGIQRRTQLAAVLK